MGIPLVSFATDASLKPRDPAQRLQCSSEAKLANPQFEHFMEFISIVRWDGSDWTVAAT